MTLDSPDVPKVHASMMGKSLYTFGAPSSREGVNGGGVSSVQMFPGFCSAIRRRVRFCQQSMQSSRRLRSSYTNAEDLRAHRSQYLVAVIGPSSDESEVLVGGR